MATDYRGTVRAGTRSLAGKRLAAAEQWNFATSTVVVESVFPFDWSEPQDLEPIVFATFNQRLDSERVLAKTTLRPLNGPSDAAPLPLQQATEEEIGPDRELRAMRQRAEPGRWLAFRAIRPLPKATSFGVVLDAGLPSAEGLVTRVARARRYHVALVDPLPAGCEPMNPALATTATIPLAPSKSQSPVPGWWSSAWYEHQNLRDERAEAFASLLWDGVHEYQYVMRATTPGSFVVPPPKAEEMYDPETFGRGASDRMIVD